MDASAVFAHHIANISFDDIPAAVVSIAKTDVLDTLGTTLAATTQAPGCREVVDLVKEGGGKEESTIIGFGGKTLAWMAALANSTMAHSLEYDDNHDGARMHSGAVDVPACFAVAERVGKVDGKRFLTALITGMDLGIRLSLVAPEEPRCWHQTTLYGFFGAAAAASKILGLNEQEVQNALGIAFAQAAGNNQGINDGALTKRVQAGFASKGGVLSALLAQRGITGAVNSLEGEFGLYKVYHGGKYSREALLADLGKKFEVSNLTFKPYPSPRGTHSSIDATLAIVREHDIKPEDVESITVHKSAIAVRVLGEPIERKRRPPNVVDAQFSVPYTVATAVVKRGVGLRDFTPEAMKDPAVLQMADKVNVKLNPDFNPSNYHPGITEITTKAGKTYSKRVDVPSGSPKNPISKEDLMQKFLDCASYSRRPLTQQDIKKIVDMVTNLEKLDDVADIVRMLG
ncbi:MAG: MmgE/PrpD family protein [Chloroflexi bacterium]|nr:MmgE/PrpD family protein [Chloroflexota bacterium]